MKQCSVLILVLGLLVATGMANEEMRYSSAMQGMSEKTVASVAIRTKNDAKAITVTDRDWIRDLLATSTKEDFPLRKGPMSFSLPGELCWIRLVDSTGKPLLTITVYGAWNLLEIKSDGRSVLGSNRRFAEAVIRKIEETQPEFIAKQREHYGKDFSGKYEKEYSDVLKGEQAIDINRSPAPQPPGNATR